MWLVFMRAVESLKICTSIRSFCPNHAKIYMKKYRRVLSHDKEEWYAKFEEKLTCGFKYSMRNLANFHQTTQKSKNFTLMGYFCPKYMRFELKNTKELSFMTLNNDAKLEYTLTLCFQNWHKELGELSLQHPKIWKIVHWWALFVQST